MSDNQNKTVEELNQEIIDLKIRLRRIEEYILDNFNNFSDPRDYFHEGEDVFEDEDLEEATGLVTQYDTASASFLQRKMSIGYARAARLIDMLEKKGIVGPADGAKPRKVLQNKLKK